jgi:phage gpG-like protein
VCQSVTELASEQDTAISAVEFGVLNRCLDDAIAEAVTSFGRTGQVLINDQAETLQQRLTVFSTEHQRLVGIALHSYAAIKTGNVGLTGSTGTLLIHVLEELRSLADRTLPEIRLAYLSSSVAPP